MVSDQKPFAGGVWPLAKVMEYLCSPFRRWPERLQQLSRGLDQSNRASQACLTRPESGFGSLSSVLLRRDIQPYRRQVEMHGFDVLDDEALAVMGHQLADGEVGFAVRPRLFQESGFFGSRNATNETEPASPGKLTRHVTRLAVGQKQTATDLVFAQDLHGTLNAPQAILVKTNSGRHDLAGTLDRPIQSDFGLCPVVFLQPRSGHDREREANHEGRRDGGTWYQIQKALFQLSPTVVGRFIR